MVGPVGISSGYTWTGWYPQFLWAETKNKYKLLPYIVLAFINKQICRKDTATFFINNVFIL